MDDKDRLFMYFGLNLDKSSSIRQISLDINVPYTTLNRMIKKLVRQDLVLTENVGHSVACSLNKSNSTTKQHLILASEAYKRHFLETKPLLRKIQGIIAENAPKEFSAVLFGSYAAGKEQKHSDIDLVFISNQKHSVRSIQDGFKTIEQIYDTEIQVMLFTEEQFSGMLNAKEENVGKQILKNHVILHNPELFWNIVYGVMV